MPDPTPTPPTPNLDNPADADDLFARFGELTRISTFLAGEHGLDAAAVAGFAGVVDTARGSLSDEIAVAIQAATPAGQPVPDFVEDYTGALHAIDTATGKPRLNDVVIVLASNIPLPGAGPVPNPTPVPTPVPTPTPVNPPEPVPGPTPEPVPVNPPAGT